MSASGTTAIGFPTVGAAELDAAFHVPNLEVAPEIRQQVERMWRFSPTFRRQCERLAEASVTVIVERGFTQHYGTTVRGPMTRIEQFNGQLVAAVRLGDAAFDYSEYLAHEIEHVVEQIDDVNLPAAVANRVRGVHMAGPDSFETNRAIAVGRLVAREVRSVR